MPTACRWWCRTVRTGRSTTLIVEQDLVRDGEGYWTGTVAGVQPYQLYRFRITNGSHVFERLDPAARDVFSPGLTRADPAAATVRSSSATRSSRGRAFQTPRFENFIIYQFHIGSFAGRTTSSTRSGRPSRTSRASSATSAKWGSTASSRCPCTSSPWTARGAITRPRSSRPSRPTARRTTCKHFVDAAHRHGLAVIFDVVYNHAGPGDNVLWEFDGYTHEGGIYFEGGPVDRLGPRPRVVEAGGARTYFYQNARMFFEDYRADGLRFDVTTQINGEHLKLVIDRLRREFPDKYLIAEHLPDHPWIVKTGRFCATWDADSHHECQRALAGQEPLNKVKSFLGWDGYDHAWNLVKYTLGSHDDIGDHHERQCRARADQLGQATPLLRRSVRRSRELACAGQVPTGVGAEHRHAGHADDVHGVGVPHGFAARLLGLLARRLGRQRRSPLQLERRGRSDSAWKCGGWSRRANAVRWQNPALRANFARDSARGSRQSGARLRPAAL